MADQYLNAAVHKNIYSGSGTAEEDRVYNSVNEMASQMNDYSSYSYGVYTTRSHGWTARPPENPSTGASEAKYLRSFAKEVAKAHRNDEISVIDGDPWLIMDGFDLDYGYGTSNVSVDVDLTGDGNKDSTIYPSRAAAMGHSASADPNRVTNNMIMHEIAHSFNCNHELGGYRFGGAGNIREVSPMTTTYVRAINGNESDTCLAGGETPPSSYCGGEDNFTDENYCGLCSNFCRHTFEMTSCTKSQIHSNTPL